MRRVLLAAAAIAGAPRRLCPGRRGRYQHRDFRQGSRQGKAYAWYSRAYDTAHMKTHPNQNATEMMLLVSSSVDPESGRQYSAEIGVKFRSLKTQFQSGSGCNISTDGKSALNCPIDCDGGEIDARLRDADSLLVALPTARPNRDPNAPDAEPDPSTHSASASTTRSSRLDRTNVADCPPLADDDQKADLSATQ